MKYFRKKFSFEFASQKGFTLVELMIVVAIIGILASIAIPNYQKYQAKARTTEGKVQLAAAYSAQKSYFIEYSSYTGCLASAGYAPDLGTGTGTVRFYAVGFNTVSQGSNCGPTGNEVCEAGSTWGNGAASCTAGRDGVTATNIGTYWAANKSANSATAAATGANLPATTASNTTFIVGASAYIRTTSGGPFDQWSINENKIVNQVFTGF